MTRYAIILFLPMNWRKAETMSLTLAGVSEFKMISCS